jgi:hypothetical protein
MENALGGQQLVGFFRKLEVFRQKDKQTSGDNSGNFVVNKGVDEL